MRHYPQIDHEDLGLDPAADRTEYLRPNSRTAPESQVRQHLAGTAQTHQPITESR